MQKLKQTLILSCDNDNQMATVSFEKTKSGIFGNLKTYHLDTRYEYVIGINDGNNIIKQNIILNNKNTYAFKINQLSNMDNISCVLVKKEGDKFFPVLWAKKQNKTDSILQSFNESYSEALKGKENYPQGKSVLENSVQEQPETEEKVRAELFDQDENEIESLIQEELSELDTIINHEENSVGIEKKKENINQSEKDTIKEVIKQENEKLEGFNENEFFELISEQIEDLFDNYPRVIELEELIPNSKWVKIDFENNSNEYVLGLIYDGFDLKYICYGIPGDFNGTPPKQLGECQWLPLDSTNPKDGYWVIYQDAITGDKVDVI